jgi:hypothetical protein
MGRKRPKKMCDMQDTHGDVGPCRRPDRGGVLMVYYAYAVGEGS